MSLSICACYLVAIYLLQSVEAVDNGELRLKRVENLQSDINSYRYKYEYRKTPAHLWNETPCRRASGCGAKNEYSALASPQGNNTNPPAPPMNATAPANVTGPPPNAAPSASPPRTTSTSAPSTTTSPVITNGFGTFYYVYPQWWCGPLCQFYYFQRPKLIFYSWMGLGFGFFI